MSEEDNARIITLIVVIVIATSFILGIGANEGGVGLDTIIV
ncbi:hypothetical protein [Paenibacillus dendritiformis]|nr:hypothetical protein [Paenibacillus dendritiformis]